MEPEVMKVEKEILNLTLPATIKAETLVVRSEEDVEEGSNLLRKIKDAEIIIEDKRKSFTAPLNKSLKEINKTFKEMTLPLVEAREEIGKKILEWRRIERNRIEDEMRIANDKAEKERLEAIETSPEIEEKDYPAVEVIEIPEVKKTMGNTQVRKYWTYEIIDIDKVPKEFMVVDDLSIRRVIRYGERIIPGLKIYQEEKISIV